MNRYLICLFLAIPALASAETTSGSLGVQLLTDTVSKDGKIALPIPAPYITQAYFRDDEKRTSVDIAYNPDATEVSLLIPESHRDRKDPIALEVAEPTTAFPDGRIVFSALDAKTVGKAKLESHPGTHRIGFWSNADDSVLWDYKPTTWGMYSVELTYSLAGGESEIEIEFGGAKLAVTIRSTGTWYRYTSVPLGKIYLAEDKPTTLSVRCTKKTGGAVMNLKAVTLRPAPEGEHAVISPDEDGNITLMANTSTVSGLKLRYEPQEKKRCIGYWTIPDDHAHWDFEIPGPGTWQVELWQGCGTGQGGSDVDVLVGDEILSFKVEDTGHFQKFIPRDLGTVTFEKAGIHRLDIRPKNKIKAAVMDVQKVVLSKK